MKLVTRNNFLLKKSYVNFIMELFILFVNYVFGRYQV